ncbi:MAG: hypothetical protein FJ404_12860 [Verrucomicrobia bacterium]|nr:hypothetical protein [Verrucomicrobiota bacterium]
MISHPSHSTGWGRFFSGWGNRGARGRGRLRMGGAIVWRAVFMVWPVVIFAADRVKEIEPSKAEIDFSRRTFARF